MPKPRTRLYQRDGRWWVSLYDHTGKRLQLSTRCTDKGAAELKARELERAHALAPDPASAATLGQALEIFLQEKAAEAKSGKRAKATLLFYQQKAGHLLRLFEYASGTHAPFLLKDLSPARVDGFVLSRRAEGASESTISKELVTLRATLKLAARRGLYRGEPAQVLPIAFAPEYKPRSTYLTPSQLDALLPQLTEDRAARVAFMVATSACLGESDRAQRQDVDTTLGRCAIRGTKRASRARLVPLVADWQQDLMAYALKHAKGAGGDLFLPWGKICRDLAVACTRAKVPRVSPNDLRRTCATWLRAQGAPADLIAAVLGHKDSRMVERVYGRLPIDLLTMRLSQAICATSKPDTSRAIESGDDCNRGVSRQVAIGETQEAGETVSKVGTKSKRPASAEAETGLLGTPAVGLEPTTRGLTVPRLNLADPLPMRQGALYRKPNVTEASHPLQITRSKVGRSRA